MNSCLPAGSDACSVPQPLGTCLYPDPDDPTQCPSFAVQAQQKFYGNQSAYGEKVFVPFGKAGVDKNDVFQPAREAPPQKLIKLDAFPAVSSWANRELLAQFAAYSTTPIDPLTYSRVGIFQNIDGIASCEDYTYLSFYETERWIDAINACKQDDRCKVNISLNKMSSTGEATPPGIARRRPQNWDGNYIYDPTDPYNRITKLLIKHDIDQVEADAFDDAWQLTDLPKNSFYAGSEYLFPPFFLNSYKDKLASMINVPGSPVYGKTDAEARQIAQDLVNELARGDGLYEAGQGVPTKNGGYYRDVNHKMHQGFYDEWDFHRYMNLTTQSTTLGESREYRRRATEVTTAAAQLAEDMKCLFADASPDAFSPCNGRKMPSALGKVNPGDTQIFEEDIFQYNSILSMVMPVQMFQPPALFGQVGFGSALQPAQFSYNQLMGGNMQFGSQNIPASAHAPSMLSPLAITNSMLFSQLNLNTARLSVAQIESIAASETRLANILAGQALQLNSTKAAGTGNAFGTLNTLLTNTGMSLGNIMSGNFSLGSTEIGGIGGLGAPTNGSNGGAVPFANVVNPDAASGGGGGGGDIDQCALGNLAYCPPDPWNPVAALGSTTWILERLWSLKDEETGKNNYPRWTVDANTGLPILNCNVQRIIRGGGDAVGFGGDVSQDLNRDSVLIEDDLVPDSTYQTHRAWVSACELNNLIIKEWNRHLVGTPSCIDRTSTSCDWVPKDFVDRFVSRNVHWASAAKEVEYQWCKRWTGGNQMTSNPPKTIPQNICADAGQTYVPPNKRQTLTDLRSCLDQRREAFNKLMKDVPVKAPEDFGKQKIDSNKVGNSDFGGGYSYTLGWHTYVFGRTPQDHQICRLGGNMDAGFEAHATLFSKAITIIDANMKVLVNEGDDGEAKGWGSVVVAGFTIIDWGSEESPQSLSGSMSLIDEHETKKPQFVEAPFQVGWVTVTVKAGILFDLSAQLKITAGVPAKGSCDPHNVWEAHGAFTPEADLGVWVDADVSLAGIFGVGVEVDLILVGMGLPLNADVKFAVQPDKTPETLAINFHADLSFTLTTLKGELDFYIIAFWAKVASFKIVGWDGYTHKWPIFRTPSVWIPITPLIPGSIHPPGESSASEDI